jgi:hypothetical protein
MTRPHPHIRQLSPRRVNPARPCCLHSTAIALLVGLHARRDTSGSAAGDPDCLGVSALLT